MDNQIGYLHNDLRYKIDFPKIQTKGFKLNLLENYSYVFWIEDAVPIELAKQCRDFVTTIPFDNTLPD